MSEFESVYVVDDDPAVLSSVEALFSQSNYIVQKFSSALQFLASVDLSSAGCLISDVQMPVVSGAELLLRIQQANSPISVIIVTGVANVPMAVSLMESGAVTLLEKPYDQNVLLDAVARGLLASHKQWQRKQADMSVRQRLESLTEEEQTIMKLLLTGEANKGVSSKLDLSMRTVDRRRQSILKKMQVESLPELATLLNNLA